MAKKRKRKFLLTCILVLSIRSAKVNADLFAEGFMLAPVFSSSPAMSRCVPRCGRSYGILSRIAASTSTSSTNDVNNLESYFDSDLNCTFTKKKLQKKFKHAKKFGVLGNCDSKTLKLFREKLIKHMKSNIACFGHYRKQPVYHYYNPDNNLNVMVDFNTNKFISAWRLSADQIKHMELDGNIQ